MKEMIRLKAACARGCHFGTARDRKALRAAVAALMGALLLAGNALGAQAATRAGPGKTIQPAALYRNYCSVCHGDKGDGRSRAQRSLVPPPKDFTHPATQGALTREYMIAVTRDGKPGTAMAGWKTQLNDREIKAVVDYVRTTFMQQDLPGNLARGRTVYRTTCAVCHGDRGDGRSHARASLVPPPRDFTSPRAKELTRSHMIYTVNKGHSGTAMAGLSSQLAASDIEAAVDYIRKVFMADTAPGGSGTSARDGRQGRATDRAHGNDATHGSHGSHDTVARSDMSSPFPKGLKGNAARGAKFYDANCATCHGKKGDGKGPRAYFINPKPRNFVDASSRAAFSRPDLFAAIKDGRRGSEMPAWGKVFDDQQIADVGEYVFRQFIRPEALTRANANKK